MTRPDPSDVLTRVARPPDRTVRYGDHREHVADLWLPPAPVRRPLVIFIHGGFWRAAYDRTHAAPLAADLAARGWPVATIEYRRVGQRGGGWPGTLDDVRSAVDAIPGLLRDPALGGACPADGHGPAPDAPGPLDGPGSAPDPGPAGCASPAADGPGPLDGARPILAGHSAGGHLALWAAARTPDRIGGVLALAAVCDLTAAHADRLGNGAAEELCGGGPTDVPERYADADPMCHLPIGVPTVLVHGVMDEIVPVSQSRTFVEAARAAGDVVEMDVLPDVEHFGVIDPESHAWPSVVRGLEAVATYRQRR